VIPPAHPGKEESQVVLALVRGDHELSEAKLADALGGAVFRPAHPEEIQQAFGVPPGFIGPLGTHEVRILIDEALRGRKNMVSGANRVDHHVRHLTPEEDFTGSYADLRTVANGDPCIRCGRPLRILSAIEVGHIFKLGRRYAEALRARVLDRNGREVTVVMGSYGIGVERILTAAAEQHHDQDGLKLPRAIAPFQVVLTPVNPDEPPMHQAAERLYQEMCQAGLEVLYDDRDERPGVKFKDADLVGIPLRVTVGRKATEGVVEISERSTGRKADAKIGETVGHLQSRTIG
jgi:prolyl-tRNA synthetase